MLLKIGVKQGKIVVKQGFDKHAFTRAKIET